MAKVGAVGLDPASIEAATFAGAGGARTQQAVFDARFASQQFGGRNEELEILRDIAQSNRKIAKGKGGIPVS